MNKLLVGVGKAIFPIILKWGFTAFVRMLDTDKEREAIAHTLVGKLDIPNLNEKEEQTLVKELLDVLYKDLFSKI